MFCFRPSTLALLASLAAAALPCASARAQTTKVVPASATNTEGNAGTYHPFFYDAGRAQQVWAAAAVARGAAVLNSINFRRDGNNRNFAAFTMTHVCSIGHTSVSPTTMSATYAANITSSMTTIFNGKYTMSAEPAPTTPPAPFNHKYPMSTPFLYTIAKGNLLMDMVTGSGQAQNKGGTQWDAVTTANGSGTVRAFGTWGKFAGNDSASWKADAQKLVPGGSADISLTGFGQGYTSRLFVGASDKTWNNLPLPYDLAAIGAPGNNLYTGLDIIVPFTLKQTSVSGPWTANPIFPIPNDNNLVNARAFIQTYYADAKANAAGLVASDAMELTIGSPGPITQVIGKDGTTSTTGQPLPISIVQFAGAIN